MRLGFGCGEVDGWSWPFEIVVVEVVAGVGEVGSAGVGNGERDLRCGLEEDWRGGERVPNVPSSAKARALPMNQYGMIR